MVIYSGHILKFAMMNKQNLEKEPARQQQQHKQVQGATQPTTQQNSNRTQGTMTNDKLTHESISKVLKYLDDYRSPSDTKALKEEGYEIDYDRLVGVGYNSAVFLAHSVNAPPPPIDKSGQKPLYTPGYDIAVKVVAKKWMSTKRPTKTRTGNLKLALALGQTKPDNNILKVIDIFRTTERIFIFMQYCSYGNVVSFIRRNGQVPLKLAQRWSSQMCVALCFLHKFNVAHRNYKLENVLVDENLNAKLTGFGLSKFCVDLQTKQNVMSKTICGSGPYLAPEMLTESNERNYDPKLADVWAFGVSVFLCVTRRYPFEAENLRSLKQEQLSNRWLQRDTKKRIQSSVRDLLVAAFTIDPQQRPTMQDLLNQSSWLNPNLGTSVSTHAKAPPPQPSGSGQLQTQLATAAPFSPAPQPAVDLQSRVSYVPVPQERRSHHHHHVEQTNNNNTQTANDETQMVGLSPVTPVSYQANDALPPS